MQFYWCLLNLFIFFCWRCLSNAFKQDNQATTPQGSSTWIPYFLLALPAINISKMEWRKFLGVYWVFTLSGSRCFSTVLKQDNQAMIHQGSSTWMPCNESCSPFFMMFWFSLLTLPEFFFFFYQAEGMNSNRLTKQRFSMLLWLEASIPTCFIYRK